MARYYFLAASLPPIKIGDTPEISFGEVLSRLKIGVRKYDLKKTIKLRQLIDLLNIRALLSGQKLDLRGNLTEKELDECLLVKYGFPAYIFDFLAQFENNAAKLVHFSGLLARFFIEEIKEAKGFLKKYFIFEREYRLVMTAIRAKQQGRDFTHVLQFEDLSDPFVVQILAQKDAESYEPPAEYLELKGLFISSGSDPWEQHKVFTEWKFNKIEELGEGKAFSIDFILSYMVRLLLVEDWQALNEEQGKETIKAYAE